MFFSKSLKTTFKASIVLVVMAIAFLNIIPLIIEKSQREHEVANNIRNILDLQNSYIENWLEERSLILKTLSTLPIVKTLDKDKMLDVFQQFVKNSKDFSAFVYVNKDGFAELDTGGSVSSTVDLSDREYYKEARNGKTHITDVIIGRNTGEPIIIFSTPIHNYDGEFQGLIFGSVLLDTIEEMMNQYELGETGRTYLADKNGALIQTLRPDESVRETMLYNNINLAKQDLPFESYYMNRNGVTVHGDYQWVNDRNWIIVGEIEKSEVLSPFYKNMMIMNGTSLIVLAIAYLFISKVIYRRIHYPIEYVLNGAKRIISGEYQTSPINKMEIEKSPTELRELCDVYNEMAATISCQFKEIKESEEKFRTIFSTAKDAIIIADYKMRIISWNKSAEVIFGYKEEEILGESLELIKPQKYMNQYHYRLDRFLAFGETGNIGKTFEVEGLAKDGSLIPIELSLNTWTANDTLYFCGIIRDITSRKENEQKIQEAHQLFKDLSRKDGLTGISNRRHFDETLETEWNLHVIEQQPLSLILFDLDNFKDFNDTYGHQEGDDCLISVASTVDQLLKKHNYFLARYGGEEFVCLLPKTKSKKAVEIAEQIRQAIESMGIKHNNSTCADVITVSIGVATIIPNDITTPSELIKNADLALYKGKGKGRNQVNTIE